MVRRLKRAVRDWRFRNYIANFELNRLRSLSYRVGWIGATIHHPDRCLAQQQFDLETLAELGAEIVRFADRDLARVNLLLDIEDLEMSQPTP